MRDRPRMCDRHRATPRRRRQHTRPSRVEFLTEASYVMRCRRWVAEQYETSAFWTTGDCTLRGRVPKLVEAPGTHSSFLAELSLACRSALLKFAPIIHRGHTTKRRKETTNNARERDIIHRRERDTKRHVADSEKKPKATLNHLLALSTSKSFMKSNSIQVQRCLINQPL